MGPLALGLPLVVLLAIGGQAAVPSEFNSVLKQYGSDASSYDVTYEGDQGYPHGYCAPSGVKPKGCNLRGAWNKAKKAPEGKLTIIRLEVASTELLGPLSGTWGNHIAMFGVTAKSGFTTISLNSTANGYQSEFIRWTNFDKSNFIYLSHLNIQGFHLSEPRGPPVQEFGGAINLGCEPQQTGFPNANACEKAKEAPVKHANIIFTHVNFTSNSFHPSDPAIDEAYGAAVAMRCQGCWASLYRVNFVHNKGSIPGPAHGILWTNLANYTANDVNFVGNTIRGSKSYICPGYKPS